MALTTLSALSNQRVLKLSKRFPKIVYVFNLGVALTMSHIV